MVRLKVTSATFTYTATDEFQFHNGSIKSRYNGKTQWHPMPFQFHNGAIKSREMVNLMIDGLRFQFHNGAIKSGVTTIYIGGAGLVSIPQWGD